MILAYFTPYLGYFYGPVFRGHYRTGLKGIARGFCPYCNHEDDQSNFMTKAQVEYLQSIALKTFVEPLLKDFGRSLEQSTRGGFIQIKVKTSGGVFRVKYYQERDLETCVIFDSFFL